LNGRENFADLNSPPEKLGLDENERLSSSKEIQTVNLKLNFSEGQIAQTVRIEPENFQSREKTADH
jgi:hypothetical protein